jgi:hypothetical protein
MYSCTELTEDHEEGLHGHLPCLLTTPAGRKNVQKVLGRLKVVVSAAIRPSPPLNFLTDFPQKNLLEVFETGHDFLFVHPEYVLYFKVAGVYALISKIELRCDEKSL